MRFRNHAAELTPIEAFLFHKGERIVFFVSTIDIIGRAQRADHDRRDAALMCGAQEPEAIAVVLRCGELMRCRSTMASAISSRCSQPRASP